MAVAKVDQKKQNSFFSAVISYEFNISRKKNLT